MKWLRALTRRLRRPRHAGTLQVTITADVAPFLRAMNAAQQQTYRTLRRHRIAGNLAWIRAVAEDELAAGRHHVRRLADQTYVDLGLTRPLVTRHDRKDPS